MLPLDMIRYLIVCRVNAPMIWFHHFPPLEFSLVLGTIIAESLPTVQARPWHQALEPWKAHGGISVIKKEVLKQPPMAAWPVESVFFCYPRKRAYAYGELVLMELKLMGKAADHAFFLEVILPALEKASQTIDRSWQRIDSLWGNFDIQYIYVAHGSHWDILVDDCTLDLKYTAKPDQWREGLALDSGPSRMFQNLTWVTPFDLRGDASKNAPCYRKRMTPESVPSLKDILVCFKDRISSLSAETHTDNTQLEDMITEQTKISFEEAIDISSAISAIENRFYPTLESQPGCWIGQQRFEGIPNSIVPYLALSTIFHVGAHTHFGCGTFLLD